jgi:hypothetical protein
MSRLFYHVCQDNLGNLLFDVSGTMRVAGSGTLATIYGDENLTVILPNPMTNHPSFGSFKCFLGSGDYDWYMAKSGYTFETLTGVQGHGTMAQQDASAVAITGGVGTFTNLSVTTLDVAGNSTTTGREICGQLGVNGTPDGNVRVQIAYNKSTDYGLKLRQTGTDTGSYALLFNAISDAVIGSIVTTASATAYNTTSDARLKTAIAPLTGALDVVRALNPVSFLWQADGSPGRGFLAGEVQEVVDGVITGDKDAVDEQGNIVPQQIDHSKLVPYLTAAVKDLAQQVEALTARLEAAGA